MQIEIHIPDEQIAVISIKVGWAPMIEDTTQPMVGDSHPMIENPVTAAEFFEGYVNTRIVEMFVDHLRGELKTMLDDQYGRVHHKLVNGGYDVAILTMPHDDVAELIDQELIGNG
ncbi:MAG: hypothetical protein AAGA37_19715 [Actinomycetota bacterium]